MAKTIGVSGALLTILFGAFLGLFLLPLHAFAVTAAPIVQSVTQPDGVKLSIQQFGDEWSNGFRTLDGYTILKDGESGFWKYAQQAGTGALQESSFIAGEDSPKGIAKNLHPTPSGPSTSGANPSPAAPTPLQAPLIGSSPVLVIFTDFTPSAKLVATAPSLSAKFFGSTGSVKNYYQTVSYGAFSMTPAAESNTALGGSANDGIVAVTLPYAHPNPGSSINDTNRTITRDAILAADPYVNFASYDTNNDGVVSASELHIVVVVAGAERAYNSGQCGPSVWGHKWNLFGAVAVPIVDGKSVGSSYTQFGETHCDTTTGGHEVTIGIMVHELGHDIGLPDLYDTDGTSAGIGGWSVMGSGNWGGVTLLGDSPAHFDPWSKFFEGWITPTVATNTLTNEPITQSATTPDVYQFLPGTPTSGEYFLVENRQKANYDVSVPGSGLLVWHIDASISNNQNECYPGGPSCASGHHYKVAVVQADNLYELERNVGNGNAGDPFPGSTGNPSFTSVSSPASLLYSGASSGVSITSISGSGSTITATLSGSGADVTAPSAPTNLAGTPSGTQVALTWTASTDNIAVTGYKIYRGSVEIASVVGTSYTDTGLTPGTTYQYAAKATDAAGNLSAASNTASVTMPAAPDITPPSAPTSLAGVASTTQISLSWTASTDNVGVTGYRVYRNGVHVGTSTLTSYVDTGLAVSTAYQYTVKAIDAAGNLSLASNVANVTTLAPADTTAPSAPTNLAGVPSGTQVSLTWTASTDNVGVVGYRLYRNGSQVGAPVTTSYTDTGLTPSTTYQYTVKAVDAAGNLSAASNVANVTTPTTPDTTAPSAPTNLSGTPSGTQVSLTWTASTDNVGVLGYKVYRGGIEIANVTSTLYVNTGLTAGATYAYSVKAVDAAGNISLASNTANVTVPVVVNDTLRPSTPTGLVGVGGTGVALTWTGSTDNVGVVGYNIIRANVVIATSPTTSFTDTTGVVNTLYAYKVQAYDAAGNLSIVSNTVITKSLSTGGSDTTPPSAPTNLAGTPSGTQVALAWAASTDNVGVTGYKVYRGGVEIANVTGTSYVNTGLTAGATYAYTVKAVDAAGNLSSASNTASVTVPAAPDTIPPSAPANLNGTPSGTQVSLTWTASTDNVGVVGYRVYRNGVQVAAPTLTAYTDTGLTPGITYQYTAKAVDAAGNLSAASNIASVTIPNAQDTVAPSAPTNLAGVPSGTQVSLTWSASTDNVGVVGYRVYRSGIQVATPSGTSYTDTGLAPSTTYQYAVKAVDAAGNLSAASNTANVTTPSAPDALAPSAPTNLAGIGSGTQAALTWTASTDNVGVTGYKVYRGGVEVAAVAGTSYTDTGLTPGATYQYTVKATDAAGNISLASNTASVTIPAVVVNDALRPSTPSNLVAVGNVGVALTWTGSTDNVGVVGYNIIRANIVIATSVGTSFTDMTGDINKLYAYKVQAYDAAGNLSTVSNTVITKALSH